MSTSSRQVGQHFEYCLSIIRQASIEILTLLKLRVTEGKDPRWFLEQLDQARLNLGGWGAVARRLSINDSQLSEFMLQLRHLQQGIPSYEHGQGATENQLIAALRFVVTLEQIKQQQPLLMFNTNYANDAEQLQESALRQLRGVELTLRGLIGEVWPDEPHLHPFLKSQFGAQACARWHSRSPSGELLDGMTFSEMALPIVDKKTFSRHFASLFNYASALTFLVEQRVTLHLFLDDIRRMRNSVLSHRPLGEMECLLLEIYAQQIAAPVQRAYEQGRTRVNPASLMAADGGEVQQFWERAHDAARRYGLDGQPIPDSIERLSPEKRQRADSRERIIAAVLWCAVGVTVLGIVLGGIGLLTASPEPAPLAAAQHQPQAMAAESRVAVSPREALARRGILWDSNALRSAIDSNNIDVAELFLRGGMNWQLAWTDRAMSAGYDTVLNMLLRYRLQMDEPKPCRRFINTLTHEMSQGAPLNRMRQSYLQTFCTTPAVVARQRLAVDNAQRRNKATGNAESKKGLQIQKAIYDVIR